MSLSDRLMPWAFFLMANALAFIFDERTAAAAWFVGAVILARINSMESRRS